MKESNLQRAVIKWLRLHRVEHWRMPLGAVLHQAGGKMIYKKNPLKGFPDLAGLVTRGPHRGRLWVIELKSANGRLSNEQKEWAERLKNGGAAYAVVKSLTDLTDFFLNIGEIERRNFGFLFSEKRAK
jgi:hypothetical protein